MRNAVLAAGAVAALYAFMNAMRFLDFGYSATVMVAGFLLLTSAMLAAAVLLRLTGLLRPVQS